MLEKREGGDDGNALLRVYMFGIYYIPRNSYITCNSVNLYLKDILNLVLVVVFVGHSIEPLVGLEMRLRSRLNHRLSDMRLLSHEAYPIVIIAGDVCRI